MRLSALIAALAVAAPIGFCAGSASAQFFQGQSVLGGRPLGSPIRSSFGKHRRER